MAVLDTLPAGHRYQLGEWIGAGGYSQVWRAKDTLLDRDVAVKLLHAGYAADSQAVARFAAEARHCGALNHENIARVYDYGEPGPQSPPYLVMELVEGQSLADRLEHGPLSVPQALDVIAQAAAGLAAAHNAGIIHRDVKPANLLLSRSGTVKITDFGISHAIGSAPVTASGMIIGTTGYVAPERAAGAQGGAASDLYALGMVGYECLAGIPPFSGTAIEQALAHRAQPLPPLPATVPAEVADFVAQLADKDPAHRPGSAAEVASRAWQLRNGLAGQDARPRPLPSGQANYRAPGGRPTSVLPAQPSSAQPPSGQPSSAQPLGSRTRRAAIAAACLALALGGLILASTTLSSLGSSPRPPASAHGSGSATVPGPRTSAVLAVDVNGAALTGEPVRRAARDLRRQGLAVSIVWESTDQQLPGRVVRVEPAGRVPRGSLVTVVGARQRAASSPPGDSGHGQHHGNGDGTNQGNGNSAGSGAG
jgi:eukaryotic-like serine/threonine-protein kinase